MARILVFCGASAGNDPKYAALAREVGTTIAARGLGLVYGGGHVGLMGITADAAMRAGAEVIGVIPRFLKKAELAHTGVSQLILVDSMHERKQRMFELSDAVIAMPGGFGTMDELFELLTWRQLSLHNKPIGLLNAFGFYDALLQQVERMRVEGFLHGVTTLHIAPTADLLLDQLSMQRVR